MTPKMQDIHQGIVHCISATLNELKKNNTTVGRCILVLFVQRNKWADPPDHLAGLGRLDGGECLLCVV